MWIHSSGSILKRPRSVKGSDGTQHPAQAFLLWPNERLYDVLGYRPFIENGLHTDQFYKKVGSSDEVVDGVVIRTYSHEPRFSISDLKKKLGVYVKKELFELFREARAYADFLAEYDPGGEEGVTLLQYKEDLKSAYLQMKVDVSAMTTYEELVEFYGAWRESYLPSSPINEG